MSSHPAPRAARPFAAGLLLRARLRGPLWENGDFLKMWSGQTISAMGSQISLLALPFSLSVSFYPLLLAQFGYAEASSGVLLAVRALGAVAAGLVVGRFVRSGPDTLWPVACGVTLADWRSSPRTSATRR